MQVLEWLLTKHFTEEGVDHQFVRIKSMKVIITSRILYNNYQVHRKAIKSNGQTTQSKRRRGSWRRMLGNNILIFFLKIIITSFEDETYYKGRGCNASKF